MSFIRQIFKQIPNTALNSMRLFSTTTTSLLERATTKQLYSAYQRGEGFDQHSLWYQHGPKEANDFSSFTNMPEIAFIHYMVITQKNLWSTVAKGPEDKKKSWLVGSPPEISAELYKHPAVEVCGHTGWSMTSTMQLMHSIALSGSFAVFKCEQLMASWSYGKAVSQLREIISTAEKSEHPDKNRLLANANLCLAQCLRDDAAKAALIACEAALRYDPDNQPAQHLKKEIESELGLRPTNTMS